MDSQDHQDHLERQGLQDNQGHQEQLGNQAIPDLKVQRGPQEVQGLLEHQVYLDHLELVELEEQ